MSSCANCGSFILFGGKDFNGKTYCGDNCLQVGYAVEMTNQIPHDVIEQQIDAVHQGACPNCKGRGPVDVHRSYRVWSALVLTSWSNPVHVSCRSCAVKSQITSTLFCLVLGWWGFPFGLIMTPVQIFRNFIAMFS